MDIFTIVVGGIAAAAAGLLWIPDIETYAFVNRPAVPRSEVLKVESEFWSKGDAGFFARNFSLYFPISQFGKVDVNSPMLGKKDVFIGFATGQSYEIGGYYYIEFEYEGDRKAVFGPAARNAYDVIMET